MNKHKNMEKLTRSGFVSITDTITLAGKQYKVHTRITPQGQQFETFIDGVDEYVWHRKHSINFTQKDLQKLEDFLFNQKDFVSDARLMHDLEKLLWTNMFIP